MITNYYTLRALVEEWNGSVPGLVLIDAFSQQKGELSLAFAGPSSELMIRLSVHAPNPYLFRVEGYSKAKKNVATQFESAFEQTVTALRIADRDRMIYFDLSDGRHLQVMLFGPRANVFLVSNDGRIREAFRNSDALRGGQAPESRAAPEVNDFDAFMDRWGSNRKTLVHALSSAYALWDRTLGREAVVRAGLDPDASPELSIEDAKKLYRQATEVESEIQEPRPCIYWAGRDPTQFSLIPLISPGDAREQRFESVDEAVATFVKSNLAQRHFEQLYRPVEKALSDAAIHYSNSAERMLEELAQESRAERYEKYGHLLMANVGRLPAGADLVEVEDLFGDREPVPIPLDPAKSEVENARSYYDRARRTRRSREEAEKRLGETAALARQAQSLLEDLGRVEGLKEIRDFRKERAGELSRYLADERSMEDRLPFRRFRLEGGYEVWVGRNAKQNDELTFRHAQKYDLWMHARGVPGSHAVLRLPNRNARPGRPLIEQAASIAAFFSKARGSGLVPVIVVERKHVRKPKGAGPGAVLVEREDVLLVEPRLPA